MTDYHQEAQKTKAVATYRLARDIYKEYLDNFPKSDSAYNLRFYYAEILYALLEWEPAAEQYSLTVKADPKGLYSKSAAYNELLSYEKLVQISKGTLAQRETLGQREDRREGQEGHDHARQAGQGGEGPARGADPQVGAGPRQLLRQLREALPG